MRGRCRRLRTRLEPEVSPFARTSAISPTSTRCSPRSSGSSGTWTASSSMQVPELPLDRGEHRVEVGEIADVRANGETSGSKRVLSRLQRPLIQAADGDARALSVKFLRRGQPDPAVAAGDKDILVR